MTFRSLARHLLAAATCLVLVGAAVAQQSFPARIVRIIVPFPAGAAPTLSPA